jgi:hypothetical protein
MDSCTRQVAFKATTKEQDIPDVPTATVFWCAIGKPLHALAGKDSSAANLRAILNAPPFGLLHERAIEALPGLKLQRAQAG